MCFLILDDFWNDLKFKGQQLWRGAKEYVHDNKSQIYDLIANLVSSVVPAAKPIVDGLRSAYGG